MLQEHIINNKFIEALTYKNIELPYYLKGLLVKYGWKDHYKVGGAYLIELYQGDEMIIGIMEMMPRSDDEEEYVASAWRKFASHMGIPKYRYMIEKRRDK
jgi:hypothetical protein